MLKHPEKIKAGDTVWFIENKYFTYPDICSIPSYVKSAIVKQFVLNTKQNQLYCILQNNICYRVDELYDSKIDATNVMMRLRIKLWNEFKLEELLNELQEIKENINDKESYNIELAMEKYKKYNITTRNGVLTNLIFSGKDDMGNNYFYCYNEQNEVDCFNTQYQYQISDNAIIKYEMVD